MQTHLKSWLIVIEGIDQSGKSTQAELLCKRFEGEGYRTKMLSFPNYKTRIGKLIRAFLHGEIEYPAQVRHMLLSVNRWEMKAEIEKYLQSGLTLVCNRYYHSNIPYGVANGLNRRWLESLDEGLPKPAFVILIDVKPKTSLARKGTNRDIHERDLKFLSEVRKQYLILAKEDNWIVVNGENSIEKVSKEIWKAIAKKLKT